jgi:hypothetical protein
MLYIYNQRSKHVFTLARTSISAKNLRHGDNLIFWIQVLFLMRRRWSCFHVEHNFKIRFRSKIIVTLKLQLWSWFTFKKNIQLTNNSPTFLYFSAITTFSSYISSLFFCHHFVHAYLQPMQPTNQNLIITKNIVP